MKRLTLANLKTICAMVLLRTQLTDTALVDRMLDLVVIT